MMVKLERLKIGALKRALRSMEQRRFTEDRIGVLFTITHSLHRLGLSIHVAKISTNVDQVADVFYVTDESGGKVADADRVETIRQVLRQTLAPQTEARERVAEPVH